MEIDQVKSNVKKMLSKGATEQEVDQYLSYKGVTAEQLRAHKNQTQQEKGMLEGALDTVGDVAHTVGEYSGLNAVGKFAKDAYVGKQDPQYQNLEGFSGSGINDMGIQSQIARGKVSTITDKGFAGVIKNALGDRLVNTTKDKHGQEIISYKNDDGEIVQEYINKPGLDYQDIDRVAESAVPFVFGGGLAGSMAKGLGLGLMGRTVAQGTTAAVIDGGLQNQAQKDGSGEDYSVGRTALAGLGGAGGEVAGTILTKLFNGRGLVDKTTGKLTEKGRAWAKANRVDPDSLSDQTTEYLRQNIGKAADPEELARMTRAQEFDLKLTKAQRTKNPQHAFTEKEISQGNFKEDAQRVYTNFKNEQYKSVEDAALNKVGKDLAPEAVGKEKATLGNSIGEGLEDAFAGVKKQEKALWSEIGPMYPKDGAFESLPEIVNKKALKAGVRPVEGLTDKSIEMQKTMQEFMTGDLTTKSFGILTKRANDNIVHKKGSIGDFLASYTRKEKGIPRWDVIADYNDYRLKHGLDELELTKAEQAFRDAGLPGYKQAMRVRLDLDNLSGINSLKGTGFENTDRLSIDEVRRMLLNTKEDAATGSQDARLANHLYEGFNDWIDDAAQKALIQADDPAAYAVLKSARAFTRDLNSVFKPVDKGGRLTPGGRKLKEIMENAESPESVVSTIFGRGSEFTELPKGSVESIKRLKIIFTELDKKNPTHTKALDSIKMAYWVKLMQGKNGKLLSPKVASDNIDKAFANQRTAINLLFDKKELALMKRFQHVLKDLHVPDPNASNSGVKTVGFLRQFAKGGLNTQATRERFTHQNFKTAYLLNFIAKNLEKIPGIDYGQYFGNRFIKQGIQTRSKNSLNNSGGIGAIGTLTGANIEE